IDIFAESADNGLLSCGRVVDHLHENSSSQAGRTFEFLVCLGIMLEMKSSGVAEEIHNAIEKSGKKGNSYGQMHYDHA
ncbi:MAG: hypothetical protein JSV19_02530, partial [Phycisphaerales bacterium]